MEIATATRRAKRRFTVREVVHRRTWRDMAWRDQRGMAGLHPACSSVTPRRAALKETPRKGAVAFGHP